MKSLGIRKTSRPVDSGLVFPFAGLCLIALACR